MQVTRPFIAAALALVLGVSTAAAGEFGSLLKIFADSQNNYVLTGALQHRTEFGDRYGFTARGLVDGISSASAKTGSGVDDAYLGGFSNRLKRTYKPGQPDWTRARAELAGFGDAAWGDTSASAGYLFSAESNYNSHTVFASLAQGLFLNNSVPRVTWTHRFDTLTSSDAERSAELDLPGRKDADDLAVAWQQVLNRKTALVLAVTGRRERGVLESPERDMVLRPAHADPVVAAERLPDQRDRGAASVRLARYLWTGSALNVEYQYDADEWGASGQTARAEWGLRTKSDITWTVRGRFHTQSESPYIMFSAVPGRDEYYTADARYQGFDSWLAGFRLQFAGDNTLPRTQITGGFDVDFYYQTPRNGLEQGYYAPVLGGNVLFRY